MAEFKIFTEIICENCGSVLDINFGKIECPCCNSEWPLPKGFWEALTTQSRTRKIGIEPNKAEADTEAKAKAEAKAEAKTEAKVEKANAKAEKRRQKPSLFLWLMPKLCIYCGEEMGSFFRCKSCRKPNIRKALLAYTILPLMTLSSTLAVGHFKPIAYLKLIGDYETLSSRGLESASNSDYSQAIAFFNAALKVNPDSYEALYNRGNAYESNGSYEQAIADFDAALKVRPTDKRALNRRGDAYKRKGSYEQAIEDYEAVLRIDSANASAEQNIKALRQKRRNADK